MRNVVLIALREMGGYLRGPSGALILAAALMIDGLMFNAFALADQVRSSEVLERFFFCSSGTILLVSIFLAMRLIAEERQHGTLVLLHTSPLRDAELVLGKFLAGLAFLATLTLLSIYMPALVFLYGKVAWGHIFAGSVGLLLLGATALALGLVGSAVAPNQLVAVIVGAALVVTFLLLWLLSHIASPPLEDMLAYLALHDRHFRPFMRGLISLADVVFYVSLTSVALVVATRLLEARRWR